MLDLLLQIWMLFDSILTTWKIFQVVKILQLWAKPPTVLVLFSRFIMDHNFYNFQCLKENLY